MKTEILSLLSPNAIDLLNVGGGRPTLTPGDVAAALAGLPPAPFYLGMFIYVADAPAFYLLYTRVAGMKGIPAKPAALSRIKCGPCKGEGLVPKEEPKEGEEQDDIEKVECPTCRGHKYKRIRPVESILMLCLDELWGNNKCAACGGTGITHEQRQCPVCRGRKFKLYTDLSRARQTGIPHEFWSLYKGFYNRLYTQLTDWDSQIKTHLVKRLSE